MSQWAGKYVIGLTGNIGTGKSVVRRMLEHMGALGLDADAFAHRAIAKGAPGYQPVINTFGRYILGKDGEVDRTKLARIVFSDTDALGELEAIVHPLVIQAVDWMIRRSDRPVAVVEAIKLLEANMHRQCDTIWVVYAPENVQVARLVNKRGMTEAAARQRIAAQPPQEQKIAVAGVVIKNAGSIEDTWRQVVAAWQKTVPAGHQQPAPEKTTQAAPGSLSVNRGRPRDAEAISGLINQVVKDKTITASDVMAEFGDKAFLMLKARDRLVGVAGWQVENLVARTTDIVIDPSIPTAQAVPALIAEMERASKDLQCEASLVLTSPHLSNDALWKSLGYDRRTPQSLGVAAWQEAAQEIYKPGQALYFKQLRQDRVLRPI